MSIRKMLAQFFRPIFFPVESTTRHRLRDKWLGLPARLRSSRQLYGRHDEGCGATVGVMPRCDFACRGCYLGPHANGALPLSLDAIKAQMRELQPSLGKGGNLQLTDGEVTLRPEHELVELLQYARQIELIPMLMTHGDAFRRTPGLLHRLVADGGLREISIHIDTTQRGRFGPSFRDATSEGQLNPLRDEFANMIRDTRRHTRQPLRAASTVTVSRHNLSSISDVVRWSQANSDAFRMIAFLPAAQVGRTESGLGDGVNSELLWDHIVAGLSGPASTREWLDSRWWMGHPACSQILTGFVYPGSTRETGFHPLSPADSHDLRMCEKFFERFGGLTFRADSRASAVMRMLGMLLRAPWFTGIQLPLYAAQWLRRFADRDSTKLAMRIMARRANVARFSIVTHHFMSAEEIQLPIGQERVKHCVFRVPVEGELVSMCQFNASGARQRFYGPTKTDA